MTEPTVQLDHYSPLQQAVNGFIGVTHWFRMPLTNLTADSMMRSAQRSTGFKDFGDEAFVERMHHSLEVMADAPLSPFGRAMMRQTYIKALENRLMLTDYLSRHPEVHDIEVERPVFVLGFPRTGTTVLQHLLCLDRDRRGLEFWELMNPVPVSEDAAEDERRRKLVTQRTLQAAYFMAPEMGQVHYIAHDTLEECWPLFFNSFAALNMDLQSGERELGDYLCDHDMVGPYREYKTWLQVMLHRQGADHLVLKCPEHLWFTDSLLQVFPDAHIVHTHRDPVDSIASYCSLISMQWRNLYGEYDPKAIGRHVRYRFHQGVTRAMQARRGVDPNTFYDVDFRYFVKHQVDVARDIAAHFDLAWRPNADQQVEAWLNDERDDHRGAHKYSIDRYGIDPADIYDLFGDYIDRFQLPLRHADDEAVAAAS